MLHITISVTTTTIDVAVTTIQMIMMTKTNVGIDTMLRRQGVINGLRGRILGLALPGRKLGGMHVYLVSRIQRGRGVILMSFK